MSSLVDALEVEKKILLLGDPAVGKTSLVRRFVIDAFSDRYLITIGTKTSRKVLEFDFPELSLHIKLQLYIWDVFGQQGMPRAYTMYFKGAEAAILVFDHTRPPTFASLDRFWTALTDVCGEIPGVIASNKADLQRHEDIADRAIADKAAAFKMKSLATSAKTGKNVEEAFRTLGSQLLAPMVAKYARGGLPGQKQGGRPGTSRWKPIT